MDYMLNISVRSLALAAIVAVGLWRVKSASIKHAAWTLFTAGMLLQFFFSPLLPSLPLPVLQPVEFFQVGATAVTSTIALESQPHVHFPILPVVYFAGVAFFAGRLLFALLWTRQLIRKSEPAALDRIQSNEIAVPLTVGGKILLPCDWREWDSVKLQAVIAHEEAHVRRHDWAIALIARANRCVFWFHPLAWWLERELNRLAEQACDDAALTAVGNRQEYARTLLDMARVVRASNGRLLAPTVANAMAKEANVETRINRIMDETRRIPRALGRAGWAMLIASGAPLIYVAGAVQLAPAQSLMSVPAPAPPGPPRLVAQAASPEAAPVVPAAPTPAAAPEQPQVVQTPTRPRFQQFNPEFGGPIEVPKIYNGRDKSFFFWSYDQYAQAQGGPTAEQVRARAAAQALAQPAPTSADLKVSLDVSTPGTVALGIPLRDGGQFDLISEIDQDGRVVHHYQMNRVAGSKWNIQTSLPPGMYRAKVLIRSIADGRISTYVGNFEVK